MKGVSPVLAGVAVIAGIVSANMWKDLRAERLENADLRDRLAATRSSAPPAAPAQRPSERQQAAQSVAGASVIPEVAPGPQEVAVTGSRIDRPTNARALERALMKDPAYLSALLAQVRLNVQRNYPGLVQELGLSERDADQLFDLLAQNQVDTQAEAAELQARFGNSPDQAARAEINRLQQAAQQERQRELNQRIASTLGPAGYQQYQDYQQARPVRNRVQSIATTFNGYGQPLTEGQMKSMTAALVDFEKRDREERQAMARNAQGATPEARAQRQEESRRRQESFNMRMLDAIAPHLSARQVATMRSDFEEQAELSRASQRVQRARNEVRAAQGDRQQ